MTKESGAFSGAGLYCDNCSGEMRDHFGEALACPQAMSQPLSRVVAGPETCGVCAEIEHTGGRWGAHSCGKRETLVIEPTSSLIADVAAFRALTPEARAALLEAARRTVAFDGRASHIDSLAEMLRSIDARR